VTDANNSMSSQLTILQDQIGNLDNVNATTTAAQITSLTNQIQMAYELTSRDPSPRARARASSGAIPRSPRCKRIRTSQPFMAR
jgi:hypothetical protein